MQTIVKSKKKVNPYFAGQIALVAVGYLVLLGLTALFIFLSITGHGDAAWGWGMVAAFASIASIVVTIVIGAMAYDALDEKRKRWRPYSE